MKDKVVISTIATVIISAILFGTIMAYRTYKLPMLVNNIDEAIMLLKDNTNKDNIFLMERLAMFNELSRSCKMKDRNTGEIHKFTKEEMQEISKVVDKKDVIITYLKGIENEEQKRKELEYACYTLKIITSDELSEIWKTR